MSLCFCPAMHGTPVWPRSIPSALLHFCDAMGWGWCLCAAVATGDFCWKVWYHLYVEALYTTRFDLRWLPIAIWSTHSVDRIPV